MKKMTEAKIRKILEEGIIYNGTTDEIVGYSIADTARRIIELIKEGENEKEN